MNEGARKRVLVSVTEAAEIVEVSASTIRNWVEAGHLDAYRLPSGVLRLRREDVQALLQPARSA